MKLHPAAAIIYASISALALLTFHNWPARPAPAPQPVRFDLVVYQQGVGGELLTSISDTGLTLEDCALVQSNIQTQESAVLASCSPAPKR